MAVANVAVGGTLTALKVNEIISAVNTANTATTVTVASGGTGATTLTAGSILVGNGTSAIGAATAAQIVTAIGTTAVTNATNATTASSCTGNAAGFPPGSVAEIGRYLDFHGTTANDYDVRLDSGATGALGAGTLSVTASGGLVCNGNITTYSDERLKKNWKDLPIDFVSKLATVKIGTYERTDFAATQVGVSAQSLQVLMPEAVTESDAGILSVAYGNAALAACVMLAREVELLKAEIAALKAK